MLFTYLEQVVRQEGTLGCSVVLLDYHCFDNLEGNYNHMNPQCHDKHHSMDICPTVHIH